MGYSRRDDNWRILMLLFRGIARVLFLLGVHVEMRLTADAYGYYGLGPVKFLYRAIYSMTDNDFKMDSAMQLYSLNISYLRRLEANVCQLQKRHWARSIASKVLLVVQAFGRCCGCCSTPKMSTTYCSRVQAHVEVAKAQITQPINGIISKPQSSSKDTHVALRTNLLVTILASPLHLDYLFHTFVE